MFRKLAVFAVLSLALGVMPAMAGGHNNNDNWNNWPGNWQDNNNNNNWNNWQDKKDNDGSTSVPEPGTLALLSVGLAGLAGLVLYRTRRA